MPNPVPNPAATSTTFQAGTYNATTDSFTTVLDLNDGVTFFIMNGSLQLPQPAKVAVSSFNVRTPGEQIQRAQYKNRHIKVSLTIRGSSTTALQGSVRALLAAVEHPPYTIRLSLPGATAYTFADVRHVTHNIPADPLRILQRAIVKVELDFECYPFLRGDRLYLSNLVVNPGFESPIGGSQAPAVTAFADPFANVNSYSVVAGSAPTVAANVMTLASGTTVQFGSPATGAIQQWQVRWQYATNLTAIFILHRTDANNLLWVKVFQNVFEIHHTVGGVDHVQATGAPGISLVAGTWYWVQITQFPSVPGNAPYITATLLADSAGAVGASISTAAGAAFDAVTALVGAPLLQAASAALAVGGNFANVHTLSLFGPGGWMFNSTGGGAVTTNSSGAWDGSSSLAGTSGNGAANTYPSGPVTSYGAARITFAPAGTVSAYWAPYGGGAPAGTWAMPVAAALDVLQVSAWTKSVGLGASATIKLNINEYDASGTLLRFGTVATLTGNQAAWTQLAGPYTTGANCAYAGIFLRLVDATANSANGTVWVDNAQCWDQTAANGQASMPYCELRFPNSPAQLMVSGLQGDTAANTMMSAGTYLTTWTSASTNALQLFVGRRARAAAGAQIAAAAYDTEGVGGAIQVLDATSLGGCYLKNTPGSGSPFPHMIFNNRPSDALGTYHLLARLQSADVAGNLPKFLVGALQETAISPWFTPPSNDVDTYIGPTVAPLVAQNTWTAADLGQVQLPAFTRGATADLTKNYAQVSAQITDTNGSPASYELNWGLLLPVDGELVSCRLIPEFGIVSPTWLFTYIDGTGFQFGAAAATMYSMGTIPLPTPLTAAGGPSQYTANLINVAMNSVADPSIKLDPTQSSGAAAAQQGVNQMGAIITDQSGVVYPLVADLVYSPSFLYFH